MYLPLFHLRYHFLPDINPTKNSRSGVLLAFQTVLEHTKPLSFNAFLAGGIGALSSFI